MKKYLFIGDSHAMFLMPNRRASLATSFLHLKSDAHEAISMHRSSTMFSFEKEIDYVLSESVQDASEFEAVVFIFGTNDVMKKGEGYLSLEACVSKYIGKVAEVAERLQAKRVVVVSPIACRDPLHEPSMNHSIERYWPFEAIKTRLVVADTALAKEVSQYPKLEFLSMLELLQDNTGALQAELSFDGIHFNNFGRQLYMRRLNEFIDTLL